MINPPKNNAEIDTWRRIISDILEEKYTKLRQYPTATLPTLGSSDRGMVWDTTLNKPVAWDGSSWNALY